MIEPAVIERIRTEVSLQEFLPPLNANGFALCPFHDDKKPSLKYWKDSNTWRCFGCGKGGSIFDFFMYRDHVDFPRAVRIAAEIAGFSLEPLSQEELNQIHQQKKRSNILDQLTAWGKDKLWNSSSEISKMARDYLAQRGWSKDLCVQIGLGLVRLDSFANQCKISKENLFLAGLTNVKGNFLFQDVRILFPCRYKETTEYATFRALPPKDREFKFIHLGRGSLNIGNQFLFNQDEILHHSDQDILVCEGAPDCLTALSLGFFSVATLGKVLPNPGIFKNIKHVYIVADNDPDRKGVEAAIQNGLKIFSAQRIGDCKLIIPPLEYKDLSVWVQEGKATPKEILNKKIDILEAKIEYLVSKNLAPRELERELKSSVYPIIASLSHFEKDRYLDFIADKGTEKSLRPGIKRKISEKILSDLQKDTIDEIIEEKKYILLARNNREYSLALDYYIDPEDGKPTMLYGTYRYGVYENEPFRNARKTKYYLLCKPSSKPIFEPLEYLNLPQDQKKHFPVREYINWKIVGEYSLEEFLNQSRPCPSLFDIYRFIVLLLSQYIWVPDAAEFDVIAIYCILTYLHPIFQVVPYLHFFGCQNVGKSATSEIMRYICFNSQTLASPNEAHALREPARNRATMFFDEGDRYYKPSPGSPAFNILDILKTAYKKGWSGVRYDTEVNKDGERDPAIFDPWGPKVFTSNRELDIKLADRCIVITLQPAPPEILKHLPNVTTTRWQWQPQAELIANQLHYWLFTNFYKISDLWSSAVIQKNIPPGIIGRTAELWTPLLCISHYMDLENNKNTPPLQGDISKRIIAIQNLKTMQSQSRINLENKDIILLEAIHEAIQTFPGNSSSEHFKTEDGFWYKINVLTERINTYLINTYSEKDTLRITPRSLNHYLRKMRLSLQSARKRSGQDHIARYVLLHPEIIKERLNSIKRGIQDVIVSPEESQTDDLPF